jgi:hypothetical protein
MNTQKSLLVTAAMVVGLIASPGAAALQTVNFTGTWLNIDPGSTSWTNAVPISASVTYDDTMVSGFYPSAFDIIGPGSAVTLQIGTQVWTLADSISIGDVPTPFITFAMPTGPELYFYGLNAANTEVLLGPIFSGNGASGLGLVSEIGVNTNLVFNDSSGFQLTTRVPEPSSWALLIAGFGLTGAVMRRRRVALAA